ncbi:hypothetical protein D3C78_1821660 [compost metagenome]
MYPHALQRAAMPAYQLYQSTDRMYRVRIDLARLAQTYEAIGLFGSLADVGTGDAG